MTILATAAILPRMAGAAAPHSTWAPHVYQVGHRTLHGDTPLLPGPPGPDLMTTIHHRVLWLRRGRIEIRSADRIATADADAVVYLEPGFAGAIRARRPARCLQMAFDAAWRHRLPIAARPHAFAPATHAVDAGLTAFGFPALPTILDPARAMAARSALAAMRGLDWKDPPAALRAQLALAQMLASWLGPPAAIATRRMSVSEQARADGISARTLYRLRQAQRRPPPGRALAEWIDQRALLLLDRGESIREISEILGYTPGGFIRAFKRRHGSSPAAWRRSRAAAGPDVRPGTPAAATRPD